MTDAAHKVFGLPPGVDFPACLADGLARRMQGEAPEAWADTTVFLGTERMRRRLVDNLCDGGARLLPRIRVVSDLASDPAVADLGPVDPALKLRLELSELVSAYLKNVPGLAAPSAAFAMAGSLLDLAREMAGEGVEPSRLAGLCPDAQADHWQRNLAFLRIAFDFLENRGVAPLPEARQRIAAERLAARWKGAPPPGRVILAGSTASRGQTMALARAVAALPNGAIVLPGFDRDLPTAVWDRLAEGESPDHPQARNALVLRALGLSPGDVAPWTDALPPAPDRACLLSLALRPAPVTDAWIEEGPGLNGLSALADRMTIIEAPSQRAEAAAIAVAIREAVAAGKSVSLVTPDRTLARRVEAELERWAITPDDSAGRPLHLTPPGTLLRMAAGALAAPVGPGVLVTLLKHPLTAQGPGRGDHLRWTRDLEVGRLRGGPPVVEPDTIRSWAVKRGSEAADWAEWVIALIGACGVSGTLPLADWIGQTIALAEALAAGPGGTGPGALWDAETGAAAREAMDAVLAAAAGRAPIPSADFLSILGGVLAEATVRRARGTHPQVKFLGTLEGRVDHADVAILGSLVEGGWPGLPAPDPWLSRTMRRDAGLLSPERGIGLQAHDFQLVANAPELVLSRPLRDASRPTVPSRWLNRITGLLAGLPPEGPAALNRMKERGTRLVDLALALDAADANQVAERRPMPAPPVSTRPRKLSVTRVTRLVVDPYAIYAAKVLRLEPLDPLEPEPDALARGTQLHGIVESFVRELRETDQDPDPARLVEIAREMIGQNVAWPAVRDMWIGRIERIAGWFADTERDRRTRGVNLALEVKGERTLEAPSFTLSAKADRIDRSADGQLLIYDYKSGAPPAKADVTNRDRQLALEAAIAMAGGFEGLDPAEVARLEYIGLAGEVRDVTGIASPEETWAEFVALITAYLDPAIGFAARARMTDKDVFGSDYDHLARFGEWSGSDPFDVEPVA